MLSILNSLDSQMPKAWVVSLHADNPLPKAFRKLPSGSSSKCELVRL